ncbi:MAG: EamA family transporter, partial [Cyanobacteria bacterium]|nr:EamA family transporter [Cyanobacteria bacterium GSL.Bin21]
MQVNLKQPQTLLFPLALIAPFFLWGTAMVAMKGVIPDTTPLFLGGMRILPAGVLILMTGIIFQRPQPRGWLAWSWISLFALIDGALFQGFLAEGLVRTGAGIGSVMIDTQPLTVALLSSLLFGDRVRKMGWIGLVFGIIGVS